MTGFSWNWGEGLKRAKNRKKAARVIHIGEAAILTCEKTVRSALDSTKVKKAYQGSRDRR